MMRTPLLAAAILACTAGMADAASGKDKGAARSGEGGGSTTSMGAGGLTGTGAVKDGARKSGPAATPPDAGRGGGTTAPAAGTTR